MGSHGEAAHFIGQGQGPGRIAGPFDLSLPVGFLIAVLWNLSCCAGCR